jgi:hypothetical protein
LFDINHWWSIPDDIINLNFLRDIQDYPGSRKKTGWDFQAVVESDEV